MIKPKALLILLLAFSAACGSVLPVADTPSAVQSPLPQPGGKCGNGILDPLEQANPALCPQDATAQAGAASPPSEIPPLYFLYVIHVHVASDNAPYTNAGLTHLDQNVADNMIAAIEGITAVLDQHGAKGTWEVLLSTAEGLCSYQGQDHIFRQLQQGGHEIGLHVHQTEDIQTTFATLQQSCGITPLTGSGFLVTLGNAGSGLAQQIFSEDIGLATGLGVATGTGNLSPEDEKNPFGALCANQIGTGNDMWLQTGNLLFPWRPDYQNNNICNDNPQGDYILIDHVPLDWMVTQAGRPADVLSAGEFARLQQWFDGALAYMEANRPSHVAAWGFITHIIEYAPGGGGENPPDSAALAALDAFLSYVDSQVAAGRVIYATASQIAGAAFPDR